jgi:hypothetical protein
MKLTVFLMMFFHIGLLQASITNPSISTAISCADSIFYGEVTTGIFTKPTANLGNENAIGIGSGTYKINVIENIAGEKVMNKVTVNAKYSSDIEGEPLMGYPAPGRGYIFIVTKGGRGLKFSPHHLSEVKNIPNDTLNSKSQGNYSKAVRFFYHSHDSELQEVDVIANKMQEHLVSYDFNQYKAYIEKEFGKCSIAK